MQRVITINLNGRAYQLDESAYDALRAYLNRADAQLKDNPDRVEITADLEQAIAEKCNRFLGPGKTVLSAPEIQQLLDEMGPVEGTDTHGAAGDPGAAPGSAPGAPRRLYRIREGAMWRGVCAGIAAYLGVDATLIRIIFIVLAAVSFGWGILGYFVLAHIIPEAYTSDERAAAHGQPPFNAREIIEQAKRAADDIRWGARESATAFKGAAHTARDEWKQQWRAQRREWRAEHRAWRRQWRDNVAHARGVWDSPGLRAIYAPPSWAVWMMPLLSLISLACFVFLAIAVISLLNTGFIYGWALPDGVPLWVGVLMLVVFYHLVTSPLRLARHSYYRWGYGSGWLAAWDSVSGIAVAGILIWVLLRHMPPVHDFREFVEYLPEAFRALGRDVSMWWQRFADAF